MSENQKATLQHTRDQCQAAYKLVASSVNRTGSYDPKRDYTPEEREPYDALSDRFVRSTEVSLRFFRSYERFVQAITSPTVRDTLHVMEKLGLITDTERWMDMRDVRNRIVHDYSPSQLQRLYADIRGPFFDELSHVTSKLGELDF